MEEKINNGFNLSNYSSMRCGGISHHLHMPLNLEELDNLCSYLGQATILGNGTNTIFSDGIVEEPIICTRQLRTMSITGNTLKADCGSSLIKAIDLCLSHNLKGLDELAGIPGTIGAAICGNSGFGSSTIANYLSTVTYIDHDKKMKTAPKSSFSFSYRSSTFKEEKLIILSATFSLLTDTNPKQTKEKVEEARSRRLIMGQYELPSCGSFFKNPPSKPAWKLIEEAGMAGMGIGGSMVHPRLTNFICNFKRDECRTADVVDLARLIQWKVYNKTRILLEPEVQTIGFKEYPFYSKEDFL